jgi:chemotaxis protein MotB
LAAPEISDEVVGGIEPAFYGGKKGILASATSESHVQPKELFVSRSVQGTADPLTRATVAPVQKSNEHARHPSTTDTDRPQASTTETVLAELKNLRFLSQLKVARIAAGLQLEVSDNILFAEGSAQLKLEGQKLLGDLAQVLLKHQGMISVEGHTDSRPISSTQFPSNWELSSSRASNVTRYLISHGLDPTKLRAVGYSDTRPVGTNATNEGRARNRRVSLVLEPVKDQ